MKNHFYARLHLCRTMVLLLTGFGSGTLSCSQFQKHMLNDPLHAKLLEIITTHPRELINLIWGYAQDSNCIMLAKFNRQTKKLELKCFSAEGDNIQNITLAPPISESFQYTPHLDFFKYLGNSFFFTKFDGSNSSEHKKIHYIGNLHTKKFNQIKAIGIQHYCAPGRNGMTLTPQGLTIPSKGMLDFYKLNGEYSHSYSAANGFSFPRFPKVETLKRNPNLFAASVCAQNKDFLHIYQYFPPKNIFPGESRTAGIELSGDSATFIELPDDSFAYIGADNIIKTIRFRIKLNNARAIPLKTFNYSSRLNKLLLIDDYILGFRPSLQTTNFVALLYRDKQNVLDKVAIPVQNKGQQEQIYGMELIYPLNSRGKIVFSGHNEGNTAPYIGTISPTETGYCLTSKKLLPLDQQSETEDLMGAVTGNTFLAVAPLHELP